MQVIDLKFLLRLKGVMMTCTDCGAGVQEDQKHCRNCGAPLGEPEDKHVADSESPPETLTETAKGELVPEADNTAKAPVEAEAQVATVEVNPDPPKPQLTGVLVDSFCRSDIGHIRKDEDDYGKENDQDYVRTLVVDYPAHKFKVLLKVGADGIGSSTGGERMAQAAVDLFIGGLGARLPAFSTQDQFIDPQQFGEMLATKVAKWFVPIAAWVHGMIYGIGEQEFPLHKGQRKLYGSTLVATVLICDLNTGHVIFHGYSVGDSKIYLITRDTIEQLSVDNDRLQGGEKVLDRWVGHQKAADGQNFVKELQLHPETLPFVQIVQCSDGLSNMLSPEEIAFVCRTGGAADSVEELIKRAMNCNVPYGRQFQPETEIPIQPGDDNIFVGVTQITGEWK